MYCYNCGKQIEDDSAFCPFCGTALKQIETNNVEPIKKEETKQAPIVTPQVQVQTQTVQAPKPVKKPISGKTLGLIFGILGVMVVVVAVVLMFVLGPKSIDVFDNGVLSIYGYNGYGEVDFEVDDSNVSIQELKEAQESTMNEYYNVCFFGLEKSKECMKLAEEIYNFETALSSIDITVDYGEKEAGTLSNGDSVTIKIDYDKDAFKKIGYKISKTSKKFKIENLPEPEEIDILSYVDVVWQESGDEFFLVARPKDNCPIDTIPCEIESDDNGDATITIDEISLGRDYGYKVSEENKTKTVHVGHAPSRIDHISDSNRDELEDLAYDVLEDIYVSKCGWNLYGSKVELIRSFELTDLYMNSGSIRADFNVSTDANKTYKKSIRFDAYIDSEGEYQCATEYDKESLGCSIAYGVWPER